MREAGKRVALVLMELTQTAKPGVTLLELDALAEKLTQQLGAVPAFKGYSGYKHALCTSLNEQVVHGIPTNRALKEGDILGLDFGLVFRGFYGDSAITIPIGKISKEASQLLQVTKDSLYAGIDAARAGNTIKDIARAVEATTQPYGFGIVREFVGHGIGTRLHEEPQIPNYEAGAPNLRLKPGMTLAIEPMVNAGTHKVKVLEDKWTAVTQDGRLSAHYEHTVLVTEGDPEILTSWSSAQADGALALDRVFNFEKGAYGERGSNPG